MADMKRRRQFLSSLLSSFSQDDIDPVGRNLTQCYAHAVEVGHHFGGAIFGDKIEKFVDGKFDSQQLEIVTERLLPKVDSKQSPKADICVWHKGKRILIAEIKVEDQYTDHSMRQLEGYVRFSGRHKVPFFYITKYALSSDEDEILKSLSKKLLHKRHHYEIANELRLIKSKDAGVARMIADYLEDRHMSGFQQLDVTDKDLLDFTRRVLPVPQYGYGGRLQSEGRTKKIGPIMEQTLNNARMIADWLQSEHQDELKFSIYPCVELSWKPQDAFEAWSEAPDEYTDYLEPEWVNGGCFYFCAEGRFTTKPPIWMTVSLWLDLDRREKKKPLKSRAGRGI